MEEEKWEEAFRAAHTIKGVCQNLSFDALLSSAEPVTEALRAGNIQEAKEMKAKLDADYKKTVDGIREFSQDPA